MRKPFKFICMCSVLESLLTLQMPDFCSSSLHICCSVSTAAFLLWYAGATHGQLWTWGDCTQKVLDLGGIRGHESVPAVQFTFQDTLCGNVMVHHLWKIVVWSWWVHVRFVVDTVELRLVFSGIWFGFPLSIIPPVLHTHSLICHWCQIITAHNSNNTINLLEPEFGI
jgi:hypothetical protein